MTCRRSSGSLDTTTAQETTVPRERIDTEANTNANTNTNKWVGLILSLSVLVGCTILIGICADALVDSFRSLNRQGLLQESFVGLIIIPAAGNAAEIIATVMVSVKGEIDLALNIAIGTAIQIGLFVAPLMILVGWAIGQDMTLNFDPFEIITLLSTAAMVLIVLLKVKSSCLEGVIMLACFVWIV